MCFLRSEDRRQLQLSEAFKCMFVVTAVYGGGKAGVVVSQLTAIGSPSYASDKAVKHWNSWRDFWCVTGAVH